jgi:hypothetical protein
VRHIDCKDPKLTGQRSLGLEFAPVERMIGGELVRMPPNAVMGAEMLEMQGTKVGEQGTE